MRPLDPSAEPRANKASPSSKTLRCNPPNRCSHTAFVFATRAGLLNLARAVQLTNARPNAQNRKVEIPCNLISGRAGRILSKLRKHRGPHFVGCAAHGFRSLFRRPRDLEA